MRSTEFIQEAGPGGPGFAQTPAQLAARAAQGEKNAQGIKNFFAGAPQTGAASNMAQDPAQQAGQGAPAPEAPAPQTGGTAVPTARDPAQIAGQGVTAPDAPVPASPPVQVGTGVAPPTQAPTPVPKKTFTPDPAGVAIAQQLKMDSNAIKLFQKNQGLNPDGRIGPQTTAALKAAQLKQGNVAANDKGGARGGAAFAATDPRRTDAAGGGQTGYNSPPFAAPAGIGVAPPAGARPPAGIGVAPPAPRGGNLRNPNAENLLSTTESKQRNKLTNFEESVDRMRRLSNMLKG
jgi:hypothetical protein